MDHYYLFKGLPRMPVEEYLALDSKKRQELADQLVAGLKERHTYMKQWVEESHFAVLLLAELLEKAKSA